MPDNVSAYREHYCHQAKQMIRLGASDADLCQFFQIASSTLYKWKLDFPEFKEAIQRSKEEFDEAVEVALYRKATGYTQKSVKIMQYEGQPIEVPFEEYFPPDTASMIFWLKNRQRDRWKDRIEHTGADGGPLVVQTIAFAEKPASSSDV